MLIGTFCILKKSLTVLSGQKNFGVCCSGLFPSCAVTRSMSQSKSASDDVTTDVDLADTFLSRVINDDNVSDVIDDDLLNRRRFLDQILSGNRIATLMFLVCLLDLLMRVKCHVIQCVFSLRTMF